MIVDSMSKHEVVVYLRKEYDETVIPYFHRHLKLFSAKIYPICQRGKQKSVTLPWIKVVSKSKTSFEMLVFGNKDEIDSVTVAEFDWNSQHCYAYIKHELIVVFSQHALQRYNERVLTIEMSTKQAFCVIFKNMSYAYRTILPSPTHPLCFYFVIFDALFLGDCEQDAFSPNQSIGEVWLNTCISLREAGESQKGIQKTLSCMPFHIKKIGFNPYESPDMSKATDKLMKERREIGNLICLSKTVFLLDKMFLMMDLPVKKYINDYVNAEMKYAEAILQWARVETEKLTPYGKDGIAIRGELDYKGNKIIQKT